MLHCANVTPPDHLTAAPEQSVAELKMSCETPNLLFQVNIFARWQLLVLIRSYPAVLHLRVKCYLITARKRTAPAQELEDIRQQRLLCKHILSLFLNAALTSRAHVSSLDHPSGSSFPLGLALSFSFFFVFA